MTDDPFASFPYTLVLDGPCAGQVVLNCPAPLPYPVICRPNKPSRFYPYRYDRHQGGYVYCPDLD